jgi:cellulose synthase/poly-beta-1,6-N-acetylglucosamine synthase-like glycosyltransferase
MMSAAPVAKTSVVPERDSDDVGRGQLASRSVPVTVVIPTLDEGVQIAQAVADLWWADQVIVVDGGSRDETAALAAEAGAMVIVVTGQTIADQRNAGIAAARNEWILALDADERASPQLDAMSVIACTSTSKRSTTSGLWTAPSFTTRTATSRTTSRRS